MLESVDDDLVGRCTSVDLGAETHQLGNLAGGNGDGRTSHESADRWKRNKLDEPTKTSKSKEDDNSTNDHGEGRCNDVGGNIGDGLLGVKNDVSNDLRHDGDGL